MSETTMTVDLREQLVRIDRMREEALKFTAEQHKLTAEAAKLNRDRWLAPFVAVSAALAAVLGGGLVSVLNHLWR